MVCVGRSVYSCCQWAASGPVRVVIRAVHWTMAEYDMSTSVSVHVCALCPIPGPHHSPVLDSLTNWFMHKGSMFPVLANPTEVCCLSPFVSNCI